MDLTEARQVLNQINMHQVLDELNMANFAPGSIHLVEVTHIYHPKHFHVRPASLSRQVEILEEPGERIPAELVDRQKRVIYYSNILKKFVRGDIQDVTMNPGTYCTIHAIDYGCYDSMVALKHIYLPQNTANCPPMAIQCELYFCHPRDAQFDADATETMKYFVGNEPAKMTIQCKTKDMLMVELNTVNCPDNLSTMLAYMGCSKLVNSPYSVNRFDCAVGGVTQPRYKSRPVKVGDRLHIRVQSANSISDFYVAEINEYKQYIREVTTFTEYCKSQPIQGVAAAARDGLCCGVLMNYNYERATVIRPMTATTSLVKLVDWGKEVELSNNKIKRVSSECFNQMPAIAIHCSSTMDQMWDNGLPTFLYLGYQFIIEIVQVGDESTPHKVKMNKTNQMW